MVVIYKTINWRFQNTDLKWIDDLLVQSQQYKYQINVWNLFKVNNKVTRKISHIVLVFPLLTLNK